MNVTVKKIHGLDNQQPSPCEMGKVQRSSREGVGGKCPPSAQYLEGKKICKDCGASKLISEYYENRKRNSYDACCKECRKVRSAKWQKDNVDRYKEIAHKAAKTYDEKNPGLRSQQCREWYARNVDEQRERIRKNHIRFGERRKEYAKWYLATFPEKHRERVARYRARKFGGSIPAWADKEAISKIYLEAREMGMEVDHIVPFRSKLVTGLHCEANLRIITRKENLSKGNRHWPDMPHKIKI